ncbi:NAD(P)H-dependent oxidoreductase [Ammonicoccus fulvus]|uniref:NAD(P)H-dependent oxidoreductase n=1 Tax=Ammonicoccus fulvus TaxID=3138240 RepID=A0ABZ3FQJ3_9ACTN
MSSALIVIGNPNPESFTHALAGVVVETLRERGLTVDVHDLYAEDFEPVAPSAEAFTVGMEVEEAIAATADPIIRAHRQALSVADYLVIAHPNWWGKPPAIMAGWMDRVLVPGLAYRLDSREGLPTPLLSLKSVLVLNTGDTPAHREYKAFGDPLDAIWRRCVGTYLQPARVHRMLAGPLGGATDEQRDAWLAQARAMAQHI